MTKLLIAGLIAVCAGNALAEINCLAIKGVETIEVKVIDTFVDRSAFITRSVAGVSLATIGISVEAFEKSKYVLFINQEQEFHLSIDKLYSQRSLPPSYKGNLNYGTFSTDMDCIIE